MIYTVKQLDEFATWLKSLKDGLTRQRLVKRLRKAQLGNLGGGDKSTQQADIQRAIALAKSLED
jgi:putative component of toxin-antitoxin plasmid stabilization module